ncbi:hypothetical protein F0562_033664 [Nyssa sinensis]|uniref:WAT1-related protein n=1 Tax=Nyssa sinensis TaxID=561372 RepID=A0A5J5AJ80_9ASTE|nr:hypothetical protein F0562_033664 [Nyssa sinensis]
MWDAGIMAVLVIVECLEVGLNTLSKAAMSRGMSDFVFIVYSNALAFFFLLPLTFIFHRIKPCPQLAFSIVGKIFVLGLLSSCLQMCMYIGIGYSSPTLASAMIDLTPAFTFLLAIFTRMEELDLKVQSSQAKSIGTIILITGAFIVTFYKGPPIIISPSSSNSLHDPLLSSQSNWVIGGFLLATGSLLLALLYIFQARIINEDPNAWKLRPDVELVTIVYSAILVVSLRSVVQIWALHKKGPVYVTMFKPLEMVIAVVMGITFLGDTLYIGSVIGAATIALGFYSVMWGKAKEEKTIVDNEMCGGSDSSSHEVPLLRNKRIIALLVVVECLEVGLNTVSKAAMRGGMSSYVFVVYSNVLAFLFLVPSTFIYHRFTSPPPKLTFSMVCRIFVLGLVRCLFLLALTMGLQLWHRQ